MRIISIRYRDNTQKWELDEIHFFNLTLLVGISGVGKTQILNSILRLKSIANGKSLNGVEWNVSFKNEEQTYVWSGKFESLENLKEEYLPNRDEDDNDEVKPKIMEESVTLNNELIAKRKDNEIFFQGQKMPKLSSEESLINIFKEEETILPAFEGFKKIIFRDHTRKEGGLEFRFLDLKKIKKKFSTLEAIRNSDLDITTKLTCLYENQKEAFQEIINSYKDVFPQVEDVKIAPSADQNLPTFLADIPIIQFKEKGVDTWILQDKMSSGMIRSFIHISEMYLLSAGTVVLIDEFENSLGVNCIDILTEDLIYEHSRLQFIATSHHPYIINKIPYEYWKIVTRKGGKIKTFDARAFKLGESSHERFINLINLPQYKKGIETFAR